MVAIVIHSDICLQYNINVVRQKLGERQIGKNIVQDCKQSDLAKVKKTQQVPCFVAESFLRGVKQTLSREEEDEWNRNNLSIAFCCWKINGGDCWRNTGVKLLQPRDDSWNAK